MCSHRSTAEGAWAAGAAGAAGGGRSSCSSDTNSDIAVGRVPDVHHVGPRPTHNFSRGAHSVADAAICCNAFEIAHVIKSPPSRVVEPAEDTRRRARGLEPRHAAQHDPRDPPRTTPASGRRRLHSGASIKRSYRVSCSVVAASTCNDFEILTRLNSKS